MNASITKLSSGVTVVTQEMPGLQSAALGVWVDAGSRHEMPARHGISHMLEHMAFKGTHTRSAREIVESIENAGGSINAATSHESTAYTARVLSEDVALSVDVLADIVQNPVFAPEELERERGVIVQEIAQALDTPDDLVFDHIMAAAYPGQALGRSILGTRQTVGSFSREDLQSCMRALYRAPHVTLAGAGALSHENLVALAEEKFTVLETALPEEGVRNEEPARFCAGDMREEKDSEQAHVILAFEGPAYGDPDYYAAQVFSSVLGGGMSSRLFQEAREKRGLCYSTFSFCWSFEDTGLFGIYAGAAPEDLSELTHVLCSETARLCVDASSDETARARAQFKAGLLMGGESPANRVEQIARQLMVYGRVLEAGEISERVECVDADALERLGKRLFSGKTPAVSAVGSLSGLENREQIAKNFAQI